MKGKKGVKSKGKIDPRIIAIGARLQEIRKASGHTSAEKFAFTNDISRAQYANYEKGADMRITSLLKVLDAHGITLAEFFAEVID